MYTLRKEEKEKKTILLNSINKNKYKTYFVYGELLNNYCQFTLPINMIYIMKRLQIYSFFLCFLVSFLLVVQSAYQSLSKVFLKLLNMCYRPWWYCMHFSLFYSKVKDLLGGISSYFKTCLFFSDNSVRICYMFQLFQ